MTPILVHLTDVAIKTGNFPLAKALERWVLIDIMINAATFSIVYDEMNK